MFAQRKIYFYLSCAAFFVFFKSPSALAEIDRRGSSLEVRWKSAFDGTWNLQDVQGHSCASGPIISGHNAISLQKLAAPTDVFLKLNQRGQGPVASISIPGHVSLSPLPKVSGGAVIYQLAPRTYFAKGLGRENSGRLDDLTTARLLQLKQLGVDYLWLTGVLENASNENSDVDVVKGDAGSYYAISDKWDIASSLGKLADIESLIDRAHAAQIRVLLDLVANHTARVHQTDVLCKSHLNFGRYDQSDTFFSPTNNYFYIQGSSFAPPTDPLVNRGDGLFDGEIIQPGIQVEFPAKVTGNDVANPTPLASDWFETVKLNYGWDFVRQEDHYTQHPRTWDQVLDVARYWVEKGVDGFRVDYAHAVPIPFWSYFVSEIRKVNPNVFLLAEAYESDQRMKIPGFSYSRLLDAGFDSIYDSELYWAMHVEALKPGNMRAARFSASPAAQDGMIQNGRLFTRYIENHDEVRVASEKFLSSLSSRESRAALGLAYTAYLGLMPGHLMLHGGQEFQEDASVFGAFSRDNGRTSIFDYVYQSQTRDWYFGKAPDSIRKFRDRYVRLAHLKALPPFMAAHSLASPSLVDLDFPNYQKEQSKWVGAYLRFKGQAAYLVVTNSDPFEAHRTTIHFTSQDGLDDVGALRAAGIENSGSRYRFVEVFSDQTWEPHDPAMQEAGLPGWVLYKAEGIPSGLFLGEIPPATTYVFKIEEI